MMKFNLQGINTDLEIELRRSKEYYDWLGEGKPKELKTIIEFSSDLDACPIGSVEFTIQKIGAEIKPLFYNKFLGRDYGLFEGNKIPELKYPKVFIKSRQKYKHQDNGWYNSGTNITSGEWIWYEEFKHQILGEYRVFLGRDGNILDIRNYVGFEIWPNIEIIKEISKDLFDKYKRALSFDVVVLEDNNTYFLEAHDYFALGLYGFSDIKRLPFLIWDWYKSCI